MDIISTSRNYFCLQLALMETTSVVRNKFLNKWKEIRKEEWKDTRDDGKVLLDKVMANGSVNLTRAVEKLILSGQSASWDLSLFSIIFQHKLFYSKKLRKTIGDIIIERNRLSHRTTLEISSEEFDKSWSIIKSSYLSLGGREDLERILENISSVKHEKDESVSDVENKREINLLKERANQEFKLKNYAKSIEFYTAVINIGNMSNEGLSILYSNRAFANLNLYQSQNKPVEDILLSGLADALKSLYLNPKWHKPYCRLGQVYTELNELEKAEVNYEIALLLQPKDEYLRNELAHVRKRLGEQQRLEHLDDDYQPKTSEESYQKTEIKLTDAVGLSKNEIEQIKENALKLDPTLEDVWKAHDYRDGSLIVKQNYELAAKYYAKAGSKGNAEALYNLALLTMNGQGVKRDFPTAISLLKQAASKEPKKKLLGNHEIYVVGVAEAQHSLGLAYEQGVYVKQDFKEACYWYQMAVDNGNGSAANNLGILHMNGIGVERDLKKAENLLLLAHKRNDTNCMCNLVDLYLSQKDYDKALLWHERSLEANYLMNSTRDEHVRECLKKIKEEKFKSTSKLENYPGFARFIQLKDLISTESSIQFYENKDSSTLRDLMDAKNTLLSLCKDLTSGLVTLHECCSSFLCLLEKIPECMYVIDDYISNTLVAKIDQKMKENKLKLINLDVNMQVVYLYLYEDTSIENVIYFLEHSLKLHSKNIPFLELLGYLYLCNNETDKALEKFKNVISLDNSKHHFYRSLYEAANILMKREMYKEASNYYGTLVRVKNDRLDQPICIEACYKMAECLARLNGDRILISEYISKGDVNERKSSESKFFKSIVDGKNEWVINFLSKSCYSLYDPKSDPNRLNIICDHRKSIYNIKQAINSYSGHKAIKSTHNPPRRQTRCNTDLKLIHINELDFTKDHVLNGYYLDVVNFDELCFGMNSVFFVIEDSNKSVERMAVYNLGNNFKQIEKKFTIGSRLTIQNPYVRLAMDGKPMIRVDLPSTIEIVKELEKHRMCRYCGKSDSQLACVKCKADYCSKECQVSDWKLLNHKFICL